MKDCSILELGVVGVVNVCACWRDIVSGEIRRRKGKQNGKKLLLLLIA